MEGKTILSIDPGTGRCGWAVLSYNSTLRSQNKFDVLEYGCIETPPNTELTIRLEKIYDKMVDLIAKFSPDEMAIEELFFVKNVKTGISVGHARGVIMLAGAQKKIPIFEYKPNEIKLTIAGYGHATKAQMQKMLAYYIKGCRIKQDDAADAVAVGICHAYKSK